MKRFPYSYRLLRLVSAFRGARHIHGHGIHSPHVFGLVTDVIENPCLYYALEEIALLRMQMEWQKEFRQPLKRESLCAKDGGLLFRLANRYKPRNIIVVGDVTGLASLYASGYASGLTVFSLCSCAGDAENIRWVHRRMGRNTVEILQGEYAEGLQRLLATLEYADFVFFNLAGRGDGAEALFNECVTRGHDKSVFVINGIKESPDRYDGWKRMAAHPDVSVAVELCRMGILLFNKKLYKRTYTLYY